jgi:L-aspartate oxidase
MSEQFNDREFDRNEETVDFDKYKDLHAWNKENKQMILDLIEESKKQREKADA